MAALTADPGRDGCARPAPAAGHAARARAPAQGIEPDAASRRSLLVPADAA